jgi:hypothetical protein
VSVIRVVGVADLGVVGDVGGAAVARTARSKLTCIELLPILNRDRKWLHNRVSGDGGYAKSASITQAQNGNYQGYDTTPAFFAGSGE